MERNRVLVVGLDGGTLDVLGPMARRGLMPTFGRMIGEGRSGVLRSTLPWYTVPGWTSLVMGVSPAHHGLLHWVTSGEDEYFESWRPGRRFVTSSQYPYPTLWDVAGAAGRRVAIVNMPLTYPAWPVNGTMVTGLLTPRDATSGACYPPDLLDDFPEYRVDVARAGAVELDESLAEGLGHAAYIDELVEVTRERARLARSLLDDGVDLGVVVFVGPDRISHKAWREQVAIAEGAEPTAPVEQAIESYYRQLDAAVSDLIEAAGPDVTVMVVADHGFGPPPTFRFRVNGWLRSAGYLKLRAQGIQRAVSSSRTSRRFVRRLVRYLKRKNIAALPGRALVDWSRSTVYGVAYPSSAMFGLVVNRIGHKREGCVRPEDVPDILARLRNDLSALVHEDGVPVVRNVWTREELGATAAGFPDLIVETDARFLPHDGLASVGTFEPYDLPSGIHERDGAFILWGPRVRGTGEADADIVDVAPTVLGVLGIGPPAYMDGKVLDGFLEISEVEPPPANLSGPGGTVEVTEEQEREIEAHLRSLGYTE